MILAPRYVRLVVSYTAAAVSAGWCSDLGHVRLAVLDPSTWSNALDHRCGRVMVFCMAWAVLEMMIGMFLPRERDVQMQPAPSR